MATTVEIGRGYVTLFVKDSSYHSAMARAEKRLNDLGKAWTKAFASTSGVRKAIDALDNLERQADRTATSIRALTVAYGAMAAAVSPARAAGIAAIIEAAGKATAAIHRAQGAADAARSRGHGAGTASMTRADGAADAARIRAQGAAAAAVIRSVGSAMSSTIKAVGSAFKNTIGAAANLLRAAFSPITGLLSGMRQTVGRLLSPAGLLGAVGLGVGGGLSLKKVGEEAIDLEARSINLGRIAELTKDKLDKLTGSLKSMGQTMAGVKLGDLFDISTMAAKMGVSGENLGAFTRDIAKMSVVLEDIPVEMAVERIGRLISVFRLGHSDAIRFGSALTALDISSTADARDILDITTRFAGLASAFRMTAADAMALATAIRQSGIPLETGGTATTQIISRMSSKRDMKAFGKIAGMSTAEFRKGMETDVLGTFNRVLLGMEAINRTQGPVALAQAMDKLHLDGQRVRGAFTQLIPVIGTLGEYVKISRNEWESLDAIETGYALKSQATRAQLELMANNFKLLAAEIGTGFLPFIKQAADGLSVLTIDLQKFFTDNQAGIEAWSEKFGKAFHKVGLLFREFPTFVKLGVAVAQEKWLQFLEILKRSWSMVELSFTLGKDFLSDVIPEIAANFSHKAINAVLDNFKPMADIFLALGKDIGGGLIKGILSSLGSTVIDNAPLLSAIPGWANIAPKIKKLAGVGDGISLNNFTQKVGEFAARPTPEVTPMTDMIENLKGTFSLLFSGALPDKALEIMGIQAKLQNAEVKLARERKESAAAAEREAAALRAKKEIKDPPKPKVAKVGASQKRFNARKAMASQMIAQRNRANAAMRGRFRPRGRGGKPIKATDTKAATNKLAKARAIGADTVVQINQKDWNVENAKTGAAFWLPNDNGRAPHKGKIKPGDASRVNDGLNPQREAFLMQDLMDRMKDPVGAALRDAARDKVDSAVNQADKRNQGRFDKSGAPRPIPFRPIPDLPALDPMNQTVDRGREAIRESVTATDQNSTAVAELKTEITVLGNAIKALQRDGMPTWLRA